MKISELISALEHAENGSSVLDLLVSEHALGCKGPWAHFTRSIDAALTLVPSGLHGGFEHDRTYVYGEKDEEIFGISMRGTAVGLCIAGLKARAAVAEGSSP